MNEVPEAAKIAIYGFNMIETIRQYKLAYKNFIECCYNYKK